MTDYLDRSFCDRINLVAIAESVNLSTSRLRSLFRHAAGMPVGQYLKRRRLEAARVLLETTFLNVKEVAGRIGLNDVSHFVRDFKRAYGVAPGHYQARAWAGDRARPHPADSPQATRGAPTRPST